MAISMDRRRFLRNAALLAAGVAAVDQLEIMERLAPKRLWAGWTPPQPRAEIVFSRGVLDDMTALSDDVYRQWATVAMIPDGGYEAVWTPRRA